MTPSDVKSNLKFRIFGPKSPKIGHWEKMLQLIAKDDKALAVSGNLALIYLAKLAIVL